MDTKTTSPNYSSSKFFSVALTVGVGLWIAVAGADMASAETRSQAKAPVTYSDLNLSTEQGARTLLVRIEHAAKGACGELTHSPLLPREGAHHRKCVVEAVDAAVARVNAPMLTALNRAQPGVTLAAR